MLFGHLGNFGWVTRHLSLSLDAELRDRRIITYCEDEWSFHGRICILVKTHYVDVHRDLHLWGQGSVVSPVAFPT